MTEIKEKIKYLKKGDATYLRKGNILLWVWWDKQDVKLISTLQSAKTEKINQKKEKSEARSNRWLQYIYVRCEQCKLSDTLLSILQKNRKMDQRIYTLC
jgi:hypothetical protein